MDIDEKIKVQYEKFFSKIKEFKNTPINEWKSNHLIGYYCEKYKDSYKINYNFKYDKIPSQCHELKMIGILKQKISEDPQIIKDYIDYYFENRVKKSKKRLQISSIITDFLVDEFKKIYQINQSTEVKITRSTQLPNKILGIMLKNKVPVKTYGDLVFLLNSDGYENIKEELKIMDLDIENLKSRVV